MLRSIASHLAYYAKPALHTFWQAALASLLATLAGSGLAWDNLPDLSVVQKLLGTAAIAGAAAVLSYLKALVALVPPGAAKAIEPAMHDSE